MRHAEVWPEALSSTDHAGQNGIAREGHIGTLPPMEGKPREEMDALLDILLTFGQDMLQKHGEFYPYGASIDSAGEVQFVGADVGEEHPPSGAVLEVLYDGLRRQAASGEIRAAGVCADVRVAPPGTEDPVDAISVALEHADAEPANVFLPYAKKKLRGIQLGELFATPGERKVFVDD